MSTSMKMIMAIKVFFGIFIFCSYLLCSFSRKNIGHVGLAVFFGFMNDAVSVVRRHVERVKFHGGFAGVYDVVLGSSRHNNHAAVSNFFRLAI